ncbi:MAG: hypothetical protein NVS3B26_18320 [Mycobacteriales bacterium]
MSLDTQPAPDSAAAIRAGTEADVRPWPGRYVLYALGAGMLAFGLRGIVRDVNGWTHPVRWGLLLAVAAVGHDLVLVPLVFAVAVPASRLLPLAIRAYVATGTLLSAVVIAVSWPGVGGYGRTHDNPSILPLNYRHGLVTALVVMWLGLLALFVLRALRAELRIPPDRDEQPPS